MWAKYIEIQFGATGTNMNTKLTGNIRDVSHDNEQMKQDISITHTGTNIGKKFQENLEFKSYKDEVIIPKIITS